MCRVKLLEYDMLYRQVYYRVGVEEDNWAQRPNRATDKPVESFMMIIKSIILEYGVKKTLRLKITEKAAWQRRPALNTQSQDWENPY